MRKTIIVLCILTLCFSCNSKKKETKQILKEWYGKEIIFPSSLQPKILTRDTVCPDLLQKKYKVVLHVDSTGCSECKLQLYAWKKFMDEFQCCSDSLAFIYAIQNKNIRQMAILCKQNKFNHPIFYDRDGQMDRVNKFRKEEEYRCFLLDQDNHVILLGNPINNTAIKEIYQKFFLKGHSEAL